MEQHNVFTRINNQIIPQHSIFGKVLEFCPLNLKLNTMKILFAALLFGCLYGCAITEDGIIINAPTAPSVNICQNVATDAQAQEMAEDIKSMAFPDERLARARMKTKGFCFVSQQVVTILGGFTFDSKRMIIAKELYKQTTDKPNYDVVVDSFVHKSDREELMAYIQNNP
jgi:hypothetical protein